jgi:hypothetical protein
MVIQSTPLLPPIGCGASFTDNISDGPFAMNRLYNGTNYVDFSYSLIWMDQYLNAQTNWVDFANMQTTTSYRGSDKACQETYQGVSGSWQGPWQIAP